MMRSTFGLHSFTFPFHQQCGALRQLHQCSGSLSKRSNVDSLLPLYRLLGQLDSLFLAVPFPAHPHFLGAFRNAPSVTPAAYPSAFCAGSGRRVFSHPDANTAEPSGVGSNPVRLRCAAVSSPTHGSLRICSNFCRVFIESSSQRCRLALGPRQLPLASAVMASDAVNSSACWHVGIGDSSHLSIRVGSFSCRIGSGPFLAVGSHCSPDSKAWLMRENRKLILALPR
jgi:hypothetical protein